MYDNSKILIDYSNYVPLSRLTFLKNANALISKYLITLTTYMYNKIPNILQIKDNKTWLF